MVILRNINMKIMKLFDKTLPILFAGAAVALLGSCKNQDFDFPNYERSTVYFAYQYPVRTLIMGEDIFDTSLDNQHKCQIQATVGGLRENGGTIGISFKVDNSLCENLYFEDGTTRVRAMPENFYTLSSYDKIYLNGSLRGGVEVQLTDAFFADRDAIKNTFVIPLVMTGVENADGILTGTPWTEGTTPPRCNSTLWEVPPMDYVLYCVKYINEWDASYLRRGKDVITKPDGTKIEYKRQAEYVEDDEVYELATVDMNTVKGTLTVGGPDTPTDETRTGNEQKCDVVLTFDDKGECTITQDASASGYTVTGKGKFVEDGEKDSWGDQDRNALYLEYTVTKSDGTTYVTTDTLIVRDRGVVLEEFSPVYKEV